MKYGHVMQKGHYYPTTRRESDLKPKREKKEEEENAMILANVEGRREYCQTHADIHADNVVS